MRTRRREDNASLPSKSLRHAKRAVVAVVGFTVLLIGVAMMVLPGPAVVVVPLGLAILATEFVWARKLIKRARAWFTNETPGSVKKGESRQDSKSDRE